MSKSEIEATLAAQIAEAGLPGPVREFVFALPRRWRFDFSWPTAHVAVECEGGIWIAGRHTRGIGFEGDCQKLNEAALLGWRVLRVTGRMVDDGRALDYIRRALVPQYIATDNDATRPPSAQRGEW